MTLREKQSLFAKLIATLILWIDAHDGWEVTLGDGNVDAEVGHMDNSLHYRRLAQDLNLFINGRWISEGDHPAWTTIGEAWEQLHPLARWGGRFQDANHFSLTHGGRA